MTLAVLAGHGNRRLAQAVAAKSLTVAHCFCQLVSDLNGADADPGGHFRSSPAPPR